MRSTILVVVTLFLGHLLFAGEVNKTNPKIKEVTVFLNRAQVFSEASTFVEAGITEVVFEGLSRHIQPQSIQVSGKGTFTIMGVKHTVNYLTDQQKSKEVKQLEDSIEVVQMLYDTERAMKDVLSKEEQMIMSNQSIKGEQTGLTAEELRKMADFFRTRITEIRTSILKHDRKIKELSNTLARLRNELSQKNNQRNQPTSTITVTVSAKAKVKAAFDIDYIVNQAGWSPVYDLRAKDTKGKVQLAYKAKVYQHTGNDWDNVKLKLSTANPSLSGTKPDLTPWYLRIYVPQAYKKSKTRGAPAAVLKEEAFEMDDAWGDGFGEAAAEPEAMDIADFTEVVETSLSVEFDISVPYTIKTEGNGELVDIQNYDLDASFQHVAVPKLDRDAFLMALVTGWDKLPLISGNANIYFEGTYVGESYLDMQGTKDTLRLSMGRDKKVVIDREQLKDYTSKKFIGSNRKEEYAYQITIRNTKSEAIEISLEDQIPVSQDSQIEVTLVDGDGAKYDENRGKLKWDLKLKPTETKKLTFKFEVKYPKNKSVSGL